MKLLEREIGSIDYAANQERTLELPRNYAYRSLHLKLTATITNTQTTAGVVKDSAPAQLVKRLRVKANGTTVYFDDSMSYLHRANTFMYGTRPKIVSKADTSAVSSGVYEVHAVLPFAMWRAVKPIDTLLQSAGLSTLNLHVDFGDPSDIFGGAYVGTVTVDSATLYVSSLEVVGVPPESAFTINQQYQSEKSVTATTNNFQFDLNVGNLYRAFIIETISDDVHVNTILANGEMELYSGTETFKKRRAGDLQRDNRILYQLENPVDTAAALGGAGYANRILDGYYLLDFVRDGRLTECLNTANLSSLKLRLGVTSVSTNDKIIVHPVELILPPKKVVA